MYLDHVITMHISKVCGTQDVLPLISLNYRQVMQPIQTSAASTASIVT
jgi:hypothetical protein